MSILDLLACDRRSARRRHVNGASNSVNSELPRPWIEEFAVSAWVP